LSFVALGKAIKNLFQAKKPSLEETKEHMEKEIGVMIDYHNPKNLKQCKAYLMLYSDMDNNEILTDD